MSLSSLPAEIISRTCRYLGMIQDSRGGFSHYCNDDEFLPLRITCRELYSKTMYDASVRYGLLLEQLDIEASHKGLCALLHITKIPDFSKRIRGLRLCSPYENEEAPPDYLTADWVRNLRAPITYETLTDAIHPCLRLKPRFEGKSSTI